MAFDQFRDRRDNSFTVDESDTEDLNQSAQSHDSTLIRVTMATQNTDTGTRPKVTLSANGAASTSNPQQTPRGNVQDNTYRPNGQQGGANPNGAQRVPTPEQQQQALLQQQQALQIQQALQQQQAAQQQQQALQQQQNALQNQQPPQGVPPLQVQLPPDNNNPDLQAMMQNPAMMALFANMLQNAQQQQQPQPQPQISPIRHARDNGPRPRGASTPTGTRGRRPPGSPTNITQDFGNMRAGSASDTPRSQMGQTMMSAKAPHYIPAAEQALQIHKNAAETARNQADLFSGCADMMQMMANLMPNPPPEAQNLIRDFTEKAIWAHRDAQAKRNGILDAQRVTKYYETPIMKPDFPYGDPAHEVRVNHKELLMLTGYFDPADKSAEFKHTWQKLYDYATMNEFQETHYMQALGAILKGEAYEIFTEFKSMDRGLDELLDYFASVYTKKRSLATDRRAVDEFTRHKNEPITACMERAVLVIDKLRKLHPPSGWAALRQQMRQNILMQVVKEETKRALQMETDYAYEDTGMPYDFEKLIRFADRFERNHNTVPKEEITTIFKVASGGFRKKDVKPDSQEQLAFLKKEQMMQKQLNTLQAELKGLKVNESRFYKNEGRSDRARESRRTERDSRSRTGRSSSFDRNRDVSMHESKPTTSTTAIATQPSMSRSGSSDPTRVTYRPRDPYAKREQSQSPGRRSQTPGTYGDDRRPRSSSYSRSQSGDRDKDRYRNRDDRYRSKSRERYPDSKKSRYSRSGSSQSKTYSRSNSTGGTDHITNSGSKTVIITINGQDYVPIKREN